MPSAHSVESSASTEKILRKQTKELGFFKSLKNKIYNEHEKLSTKIFIVTNWVDSFFGNKKSLEEKNGNRIRLYYIASKQESSKFIGEPAFKFDLKLRSLEKKLQLSFEKRGKSEGDSTPTPETRLETEQDRSESDLRGSVSFFLNDIKKFDIKLSTGIKARIPPELFARFRISRQFSFPLEWKLKTISNTFWEQEDGFGQSLSADFERKLTDDLSLRLVNESTWLDETDLIRSSHGPSLFHRLSKRRGVSYNFRANYVNRPSYRIEDYNMSIAYRQSIMRNWFFYEVVPSLGFPRKNGFRSRLAIAAKVECLIGDF